MNETARLFSAARRAQIAPFIAMDVKRDARALKDRGVDIVHMEVGEPCAAPPRLVREAAIAALGGAPVGYTDALGFYPLRERIARYYAEQHGVRVDAEQVCVTTGSSGGFLMAFLALFDAGARVAIQNPGYPAYRNIFKALGIEAVDLNVDASNDFVVSAQAIEAADEAQKLDGVLLMSPANPTGAMFSKQNLAEIAQICAKRGIKFISDEIYHRLSYKAPAHSALEVSSDVVVVNSFSKYYCMTGWRVGWLVVPPHFSRNIERLQQSLAIAPPSLSQFAAIKAFDATDELETIKAGYAKNREILLNALPEIGFDKIAPADGGFYLYLDISRFSNDSTGFCAALLEQQGLATTPGLDFDPHNGHLTLRLSYAGAERDAIEGAKRLKNFIR